MLLVVLWATFVSFPIAHMVWASGSLIYGCDPLYFAGDTVSSNLYSIVAMVSAL